MSRGGREALRLERIETRLEAYRDGELGPLARWRVRRRLARDPEARAELERLELAGALLREAESEAPAPDLWEDVRARLPARPIGAAAGADAEEAPRPRGLAWAGGGLAATALAAALALWVWGGDASAAGARSLRWLDGGGHAVMVLQDDREATIIWVIEGPPAGASEEGRGGIG